MRYIGILFTWESCFEKDTKVKWTEDGFKTRKRIHEGISNDKLNEYYFYTESDVAAMRKINKWYKEHVKKHRFFHSELKVFKEKRLIYYLIDGKVLTNEIEK